jgi:hypothetical protein
MIAAIALAVLTAMPTVATDECASAIATAVAVISYYDSGGGRMRHAVTTATKTSTPINKFGSSAVIQEDEWRDLHPEEAKKVLGAWLVTATATASPTSNPEATCVANGHAWSNTNANEDWGLLDLPDAEAHRRRLGVIDGGKYDGDPHHVIRCRRCGLWREVP